MKETIKAIRTYLEEEFPESEGFTVERAAEISKQPMFKEKGNRHRIMNSRGEVIHLMGPTDEFMEDTPQEQIYKTLKKWDVAGAMRNAGNKPVLVMTTGLEIRDDWYKKP